MNRQGDDDPILWGKFQVLNHAINKVTDDLYDRKELEGVDDELAAEFRRLGIFMLEIGVCVVGEGRIDTTELETLLAGDWRELKTDESRPLVPERHALREPWPEDEPPPAA